MKSSALIFVLILSVANGVSAQKQINQVESLFRSGIENVSRANSTDDIDKNRGFLETAIKHFTEALKIEQRNVKILLERAETYKTLFEYEKALADCEAALKIIQSGKRQSPAKLAEIYALFGEIYEEGFYLSKAIESYTTALKFDPKNQGVLMNRGFIYQYIGETAKANADFSKAESLSKSNQSNEIPELTGGFGPAIGHGDGIKKTKIEYPEVFQVFYFQEVGGFFDGFFDDTDSTQEEKQKILQSKIDQAKKIVAFNPKSEAAHWKLANLYLRAERFDEAIMEFMILVVMNKRYEHLNNMGVALAEKGRLQNAVIQFEIAVRNGNTRIEALYNRGLCYLKLNENENAIADFTEVIKLNPDFILAYQSRAKAFRATGKIVEAEADEQKLNY